MKPRGACGRSHPWDPVERELADGACLLLWKEGWGKSHLLRVAGLT